VTASKGVNVTYANLQCMFVVSEMNGGASSYNCVPVFQSCRIKSIRCTGYSSAVNTMTNFIFRLPPYGDSAFEMVGSGTTTKPYHINFVPASNMDVGHWHGAAQANAVAFTLVTDALFGIGTIDVTIDAIMNDGQPPGSVIVLRSYPASGDFITLALDALPSGYSTTAANVYWLPVGRTTAN